LSEINLSTRPSTHLKKRGWTIQHRPASITSKALLDSPGRATRKPAGAKRQFSGTDLLRRPDDSWREWLKEASFQDLLLCFLGAPQTSLHDFGARKMFDAAECPKKMIVANLD
jgi:hypothetical protein